VKRAYVDQALHLLNAPRPEISPYVVADPSALQAHVDEIVGAPPIVRAQRGTTNRNARGGSDDRRRRREWLVETYRADRDVVVIELFHGPLVVEVETGTEGGQPACRCYRCGVLLTVDTVTADRIKPGCQGGTYRRENIRPACGRCNSETGAALGNERKGKK
jgi:hypothetical protein